MDNAPDPRAALAARPAASVEADINLQSLRPEPGAEQALMVPVPHAAEPALDAHGFDPAAYRWVPVLRKPRADGWTSQRQVDFIAALADTGCVKQAARKIGMNARSCYRLRRAPGAENFAAAWDTALSHAARKLVDLAFERAIHGSDEPVFDRDGHRVGRRMRQNDRLLMFLLRAYMPERFRHAHRDRRAPDEPLPAPAAPMAEALRLLEPVPPAEPHKLMPPGELDDLLFMADSLDGELPHWHRGRGDAEPAEYPLGSPFGPDFERELEAAKREASGLPPVADDDADGYGFGHEGGLA
jgi:hypothetical protein